MEKEEIYRTPVIAFAIIKSNSSNAPDPPVLLPIPIAIDWEGMNDLPELEADCEVVGVTPALPDTYEVWAEAPPGPSHSKEGYILLGYEIPGAYHPDWQGELAKKKEENKEG